MSIILVGAIISLRSVVPSAFEMQTGEWADLQYSPEYQHGPFLAGGEWMEIMPIRLASGASPSLVMLSDQWRTAAAPAPAPSSTQAKATPAHAPNDPSSVALSSPGAAFYYEAYFAACLLG